MSNDGKFRREVISYLNANWESVVSETQMSPVFQYTDRYFAAKFKKCFGITFASYLKKFKLRKAAYEIKETGKLTNIGKKIGFATPQSFSKAFFKEFGISPKGFLDNDMEVPEMPREYLVAGQEVTVRYEKLIPFSMYGHPIKPDCVNDATCTMKKAFFFGKIEEYKEIIDLSCEKEQIAMWWHDEQCDLYYIMGPKIESQESAPKGKIKVSVPEDDYAVFEITRRGGMEFIEKIVNELADFAYGEWIVVNNKKIKILGYSFERYTKDKIAIYIPIWKKEDKVRKISVRADEWIQYIEDHIQEKLNLEAMAAHFNYSYRHFSNMFMIYYGMSPATYIKKRRLYLAAKELREEKTSVDIVAEKYKFPSASLFQKMFYDEFHTTPEFYSLKEFRVEPLKEYHMNNKDKIRIQIREEEEFYMMGHSVIPKRRYESEFADVISFTVARLKLKSQLFQEASLSNKDAERIVLWKSIRETGESECICGPLVTEQTKELEEWKKVHIKGGKYVVMESVEESDRKNLYNTYRMLYRCAFASWVKDNISKVDFSRITYVRYCEEKLYFYIPIV